VIVVDIIMLISFTRQRKAQLAELEQGHAGLQGWRPRTRGRRPRRRAPRARRRRCGPAPIGG
jgi:hypothetical protein